MLNHHFLDDKRCKTVIIRLLNGTQRGLGWDNFSYSSPFNKDILSIAFGHIYVMPLVLFYSTLLVFCRKKVWRTSMFFAGPLILLLWISGDVSVGFKSQSGSPRLCASLCACNGFLRFTCVVTLADLLMVSMATEPFSIHILATSIGGARVLDRACRCLTACAGSAMLLV